MGRAWRQLFWALILGVATGCATPSLTPSLTPAPSSPAATEEVTPSPGPALPTRIELELVAAGLQSPVGVVAAGDGSRRLFVLEQEGVIRVVLPRGSVEEQPFLDLRSQVRSGGEQGLLGLAFDPDYPSTGRFYVDYIRRSDGVTIISEFQVGDDPMQARPDSERILLVVPQPYANHRGGQLVFGPDGYLYLGRGDGGGGGDPYDNGQNPAVLLGKILRIDVRGAPADDLPYGIPPTNPFADGADGAPEVWDLGLRNPWRFSFDRATGDLYVGDVGQNSWEEIDWEPAASAGGLNYGWPIFEGDHCYGAPTCAGDGLVAPWTEYGHDRGAAIIGGYVYRGTRQPGLVGTYLFADWQSGLVFGKLSGDAAGPSAVLLKSDLHITSFGEDQDGEVYLTDAGGGLWRVVAAP